MGKLLGYIHGKLATELNKKFCPIPKISPHMTAIIKHKEAPLEKK